MINLNPFKFGSAIAALIIVALTAFAVLGIVWTVNSMVETADRRAREARDAHWTAQIERSNAEAERQRAEQIQRASAESETARSEIDRLRASLTDMEKLNASLPGGNACGLDVRRVRALPR